MASVRISNSILKALIDKSQKYDYLKQSSDGKKKNSPRKNSLFQKQRQNKSQLTENDKQRENFNGEVSQVYFLNMIS